RSAPSARTVVELGSKLPPPARHRPPGLQDHADRVEEGGEALLVLGVEDAPVARVQQLRHGEDPPRRAAAEWQAQEAAGADARLPGGAAGEAGSGLDG